MVTKILHSITPRSRTAIRESNICKKQVGLFLERLQFYSLTIIGNASLTVSRTALDSFELKGVFDSVGQIVHGRGLPHYLGTWIPIVMLAICSKRLAMSEEDVPS